MNHKNMHGYIEESEIKLKEVINIILKYKNFIILFVFTITGLTAINIFFKPNEYKIYAILIPQEISKSSSLGRLSPFSKIAGINTGGNVVTPDIYFKVLIRNYIFMRGFILKKEIDKKILSNDIRKDYVYIINNNIFNFFKLSKKTNQKKNKIDFFSNLYKPLAHRFNIYADEETGIITISFTHPSRHFAYYVLTSFLEYGSKYLANKDMQEINTQIKKYQNELKKTNNIEIKSDLARLISSLIKQKVYINSTKYYKVKVLSEPYIPDIKDTIGPRRKRIILITFIGSFILAVFLVFLFEFIKNENEKHQK